jgi:hypothetical protein
MRTNFNMTDENITMVKGDTLSFNVSIKDDEGNPVTVDTAYFLCTAAPASQTYIFYKSLGDGITQEDGVLTVRVSPSDTGNKYAGIYYYDLQIGIDGDIYTLLRGLLTLEQDITPNI